MFENWWKWVGFLMLIAFCGLSYLLSVDHTKQTKIDTQVDEFKTSIHVKILAELEKGPYLHRIIDEELGKVCYLNAVGGGIRCFSLKEITAGMNELAIKKLTKKYRKPTTFHYNGYKQP